MRHSSSLVRLFLMLGILAAPLATAQDQPTLDSKSWEVGAQPLPPLKEIVESARHNNRIYGLYTWRNEYVQHRASIGQVGWGAMRLAGPFDDDAMRVLAEDGVEVMYTLSGARLKLGENEDAFLDAYLKRLDEFARRYGPGGSYFRENPAVPERPVRHIEIWNEPNFQYMIPVVAGRSEREMEPNRERVYARVLPAAYRAVKAASPQMEVVGFGAGGSSAGDLRFIQSVHANDAAVAKAYDILSTHPYVAPAPPEAFAVRSWGRYSIAGSFATIRRTLTAHGRGDASIWYTEIGWPVSQADGGHFATKPDAEMVSPQLQAAYVCRLYAMAMRLGVERVHVMFATDTDNFNAGFFLRDGSWRPAAHAVKTMISVMPSPKLLGAISDGTDGYFAYRFAPSEAQGARPVIMAWNVRGPKQVRIPYEAQAVTVTDMLGEQRTIGATDGHVELEIGPLPLYLQ